MTLSAIFMAPVHAIGRILLRRSRAQEWKHKRREFVYLDETSVTSLIAARHGSVPESFKETLSVTTSSESGGSFTIPSTPAGPGAGMSTRTSSSRGTSQEVVRRAVAQGTFRSLRIGDTDLRISVEDQQSRIRPAAAETANALAVHLPKLVKQHRAVRVEDLSRGDAVEVHVELSPEWTYQFTTALSSMIDLIEGRAKIFGIEESTVAEVRQALEVLSRLLTDLVPIQAPITSHRRVVIENVPWLIDSRMIVKDSALDHESSQVHLAGVTELPLYWKDVRRVLFADSPHSVYARLSRPGIQTSWSPVKIADVFDRFIPEAGEQIRRLPYVFDNHRSSSGQNDGPSVSEVFRDKGLMPFGRALARMVYRDVGEDVLLETATVAARSVTTQEEVEDVGIVRRAFEMMVKVVEVCPEPTEPTEPTGIDRSLVTTLRDAHQELVRLTILNSSAAPSELESDHETAPAEYLLEAEVVAIYW